MGMQRLIQFIYPPQCIGCGEQTRDDFSLCGACWGKTPFIHGMCCDACGVPLPGQGDPDPTILCDDCMVIARPWSRGRAAMLYKEKARRFVLALKHGDRVELARAAGGWMARAAQPIVKADTLVVPIPLHPYRLLKRRYNQAALLAQQMAKAADLDVCPDALVRTKRTQPLDGHTRDQRFEALDSAIAPHPKQGAVLNGRSVLLIDDVMTSGATFAAATEACFQAGAQDVCVLALARVAKDA